jgi:hypothetical protein
VTAIVGKNGAGKTTLFDFIKEYFPDGNGEINTNCIVVVRKDNKFTMYSFNDADVSYEGSPDFNIEYKLNRYDSQFRVTAVGTKPFKDLDIIFFSNIFDQRIESLEVKGFHNLSTNYLVYRALLDAKERNNINVNKLSDLIAYHYSEIEKQLRFVRFYQQNGANSYLPFTMPYTLVIDIQSSQDIDEMKRVILSYFDKVGLRFFEPFSNAVEYLVKQINKNIHHHSQNQLIAIKYTAYLVIHILYSISKYAINLDEMISNFKDLRFNKGESIDRRIII